MAVFKLPDGETVYTDHGVYVVVALVNGSVVAKVGMSSFMVKRIIAVQQTAPFDFEYVVVLQARQRDQAREAEGALHRMLKTFRMRGEWFQFSPDDQHHKQALHTALALVEQTYRLRRHNFTMQQLVEVCKREQKVHRSNKAEQARLKKTYSKQRQIIEREKRAAQIADVHARAKEFEQMTIARTA